MTLTFPPGGSQPIIFVDRSLSKRKAIAELAIAKSHTQANTPFVREIDSPIVSNINMVM